MSADPGILLDVSRLISRLGKGPATGIDRVEAEWLAHLSQADTPHLLLARVTRAQLLLPPVAGPVILRWAAGDLGDLPQPSLFDRLRRRTDVIARAEAALRRMAIMTADPSGKGVARRVRSVLGRASYLNVGHSNLIQPLWSRLSGLRRTVLIHDTIPLDHPEYTRAGQSDRFRERFSTAMGQADLIIAVSGATQADVLRWRKQLRLPDAAPVVVAPIGTRHAPPQPAGLPPDLDLDRPFFMAIGTIEPRKNHAVLLDAWAELARRLPPPRVPQLFIIGRRGWENHQTLARLDALPPDGPIRELNGLDDGAVAELLMRSHGLLMPSRAEGFGLPLTEAAGLGIPVFCTQLASAREVLGDYARYLSPDDHRAWAAAVALLAAALPLRLHPHPVPQWDTHFDIVRKAMQERLRPAKTGVIPDKK